MTDRPRAGNAGSPGSALERRHRVLDQDRCQVGRAKGLSKAV